jgi:hypothetical protein
MKNEASRLSFLFYIQNHTICPFLFMSCSLARPMMFGQTNMQGRAAGSTAWLAQGSDTLHRSSYLL